jgi:citrate lyase subunit beta/citryl-CoA lyase
MRWTARPTILAAERAFARSMAERDHAAFTRHLSEHATFYGGRQLLRGKAAAAEGRSRFFEGAQAPFCWEPDPMDVVVGGTLALSTGPVWDADGKLIARFNSTGAARPTPARAERRPQVRGRAARRDVRNPRQRPGGAGSGESAFGREMDGRRGNHRRTARRGSDPSMSITAATARTYLFVPGDRPERFAKALASGADAVVLDLEDAVAPAAKAAARAAVAEALRQWPAAQRARAVVRINPVASPGFADDLALLVLARIETVMLPKAERPEEVARVRAASPAIAVLPLVESARGVLAAEALAVTAGVQRLVFGSIDFALDLDLPADTGAAAPLLDHAGCRLALASRAAGIAAPVAGVTTVLDDEARLLADLARERAAGFGAKLCIHPRQVAPIHAALAPDADELAAAERLLAAAAAAGGAAVQVEGRMIDAPVIERARRVVESGRRRALDDERAR